MAVTSVSSANADISVVNGTTTPVLTLNSGTGANQIVKRDSNGNIYVYVLLSTLNADITTILQSALNTYTEVIIDGSPGQYVINATLNVPTGVTLRGINNATIACGSSATGTLASQMWYLHLTGNDCIIKNLTFLPPSGGFGTLSYGSSAIYISGANNLVKECTFSFAFSYGKDVYGVWCDGTAANYNKILNNYCSTVGIQYAENGGSYNLCDGNYIYKAGTDGLQGTGNNSATSPCVGNIVSNNIVYEPGYNGIEDQQYIDSTIIINNIIIGSGQAGASGEGMAISAVGTNTQIIGNIINGYVNYGIEAFGAGGLQIEDNVITEMTGQQYGIFVNHYNPPVPPASPYPGRLNATNVVNNNITGCSTGIQVEGTYNVYLDIAGNKVKDFKNNGIYVSSDCLDISINITNNTVVLTQPNALGEYYIRVAIGSYTALTSVNGFIRINNNNINYDLTANTGTGIEGGIIPGHAGTLIEGNVINTNGHYTAGPTDISTFGTYGTTVNAVKYLNNVSLGTYASVNLSTFTNTVQIGNNWTNGATEVLFDIIETAPTTGYTIPAAGLLVKLPVITAAQTVTLPSASNYVGGTVKIWNQNTSGTYQWSFGGTVKNAANGTVTTLTNQTWYILVSDGTNWNITN